MAYGGHTSLNGGSRGGDNPMKRHRKNKQARGWVKEPMAKSRCKKGCNRALKAGAAIAEGAFDEKKLKLQSKKKGKKSYASGRVSIGTGDRKIKKKEDKVRGTSQRPERTSLEKGLKGNYHGALAGQTQEEQSKRS